MDDGFRSLRTLALPILKDYAIPAVAFVSAGLIASPGHDRSSAGDPEPYLDWRDLDALVSGAVAIQSHGLSHHSLAYLRPAEVRDEVTRSKAILESQLGTAVTAFAYPFGTRADFSPATGIVLREAGYRLGFTSQHGSIGFGEDPLELARTKVESGETLATFKSLVHGGLDAWRWIDRGLWRIQSSRRAQR